MNFVLPRRVAVAALTFAGCAMALAGPSLASQPSVTLLGHLSPALHSHAVTGPLDNATTVNLAIVLPLQDRDGLNALISKLYDPNDALYGHFLTPSEFTEQYAPSAASYAAVENYLRSRGFTITQESPSRTVIDVAGTSAAVAAAFNVHLNRYASSDGRFLYGPDSNPSVPFSVAGNISEIVGLDNFAVRHSHAYGRPVDDGAAAASPNQVGTGPGSGLAPADIKTAYDVNRVTATGTGQKLAVFELDGYNASDINGYASYFHLPTPPLQNVLVDGASGAAGSGTAEVCLDLELQLAMAPGVSALMCYEGPNTDQGVVDTYQRIATDDKANAVSTSWGLTESESASSTMNAEDQIFVQMAAQGQSIYAAAGDSGAYDDGTDLGVEDPASQPYMCGVGGTELFVNSGEAYNYESVWNVNNTPSGGAGGGGISAQWSIPSYQTAALATAANLASATKRNVPDVAFNADQYTGYSVMVSGSWWIYGGTSCAAPIWSGFTALVDQQRVTAGLGELGFANPSIYALGLSSSYKNDFHDCTQGNNLYYPAEVGYDCASGWGSFDAYNLANDLTPASTIPSAPTGATAVTSSGGVAVSWTGSAGATSYNIYRSTSATSGFAKVGSSSAAPYSDTTGLVGQTYYYEVTATNGAGESGDSNVTSPVTIPVSAPTSVSAAANGAGSITVSWTSSASATSYKVYRSTSASAGFAVVGAPAASPYSDSSAVVGVSYYYYVTSVSGALESAKSNTAGPVSIAVGVPTGVTATVSGSAISVAWPAVASATTYNVYRSTNSTTGYTLLKSSATSPYSDTSATPGTAYYYEVTAVVGGVESGKSAFAGPATVPLAIPTGVSAVANSSGGITVSWTGVTGAMAYHVYRSTTTASTSFSLVGSPAASPYTDSAVTAGQPYYYCVTSATTGAESARSSAVGPVTVTATVATPTITTISPASVSAGGAAFVVTVTGANYTASSKIVAGGVSLATTFASATQLSATVAASQIVSAGNLSVSVSNSATVSSNAVSITILPAVTPTITSINPSSVASGSGSFQMTITGTGFQTGDTVVVGSTTLTPTSVSSTSILVTVPSSLLTVAGSESVVVHGLSTAVSSSATLTVAGALSGIVIGVSPLTRNATSNVVSVPLTFTNRSGLTQQNMTITAATYDSNNTLTTVPVALGTLANGASASVTLTFSGAPLYGGAPFTLVVKGGSTAGTYNETGTINAPYYSPEPKPTLTSVTPSSIVSGSSQLLVVYGSNFEYGALVKFGSYSLQTTFEGGGELQAVLPAGANPALTSYPGTVAITVSNPLGTTSAPISETITMPSPTITGISPGSAGAGTAFTLIVIGANFGSGAQIYVNGAAIATTRYSSGELTAPITTTTLPTAGAATVQVKVPGAPSASNTVTITVNKPSTKTK